jgi:[amino group carrier protein]-6-phospho-L-2-aminoadipate/5-phospho-L-glutamate reductase
VKAASPRRASAGSAAAASSAVPVALFGASGMLAGEFLRLLELHPGLRLHAAVARRGSSLLETQPQLSSDLATCSIEQAEQALAKTEGPAAAVFALPHGESPALWARLRERLGARADELRVVDLAADYRLRDPALYESAYAHAHPQPAELASWAYGLPEFRREEIASSRRAAAPGCFATALQLATLPAAYAGLLDASRPWILHAITGSSGSGNTPKDTTHHPFRHDNLWAYALEGHRHEAELAQALAWRDLRAPIHFVALSGPFARGIHLTAALPLARAVSVDEVRSIYRAQYAGEPFVEVLLDGAPDLRRVVGSNRASLALSVRGEVLTVVLTLDNLVKGGAGQALQCLNLLLGFPETWGLPRSGLGVS